MCGSLTVFVFWAVMAAGRRLPYLSLRLCPASSCVILPASSTIRIKITPPILQLKTLSSERLWHWTQMTHQERCRPRIPPTQSPAARGGLAVLPPPTLGGLQAPSRGRDVVSPRVPGSEEEHIGSHQTLCCVLSFQ